MIKLWINGQRIIHLKKFKKRIFQLFSNRSGDLDLSSILTTQEVMERTFIELAFHFYKPEKA
ncbi:hypothetical protein BpHYR1_006183 [Brachionus plicatilis]|uniref:Uncharacterized protein n=1 Tax=Brachionus plicatilis TaxID=10195 RepID=A0A3M7RTU6_BRAPC|nr:hypothetical protein BpHYR1_006183 [Brachionus plicatilis]